MFRFICLLILSVMLVGLSSNLAFAQPGGESRTRGFMSFLDRNKNGVIEASELDRMPGRFKESLQAAGLDTSRDISQEEFERIMPQLMERMRSQRGPSGSSDRGRGGDDRGRSSFSRGPGGPPGDFSRRDRNADEGRRGGGDPESMRGRYGSFQPDRGPSPATSSNGRSSGSTRSSSSSKKESSKPIRTTVDLNKEFVPHDSDQDGQIGLYEWRKNHPTKLSDFFVMDLNGDGFLTPREIQLSKAGKPQRSAASFMFAINNGQQTELEPAPENSQAAAKNPAAKQTTGDKTVPLPAKVKPATPSTDPVVNQAGYFFKLVDRNKDDTVSPEEWKKSRSMRRMFEGANIDLTQSMTQKQFVSHYVTIKKN